MPAIGHGVEICTSTTRPTTGITTGSIIFETDTASHRWYNGTTWIGMIPEGTLQAYSGSTAPTGWLLCFGQTLNSITSPQYAALFGVLGTTYGGTGAASFVVPDLRGRTLAGKDDMGGTAASRLTSGGSGITGSTLGATGGSETHTLTTAQMPSHTHIQDAHNHRLYAWNIGINATYGGFGYFPADNFSYDNWDPHGRNHITGTTATNQNTGGGGAHTNTQPTIITNYIIKY